MASRYQTFRRIGAPIAIALALFLLFRTSCADEKSKEPVRFDLDFGDTAADVRHVRVDLWVDADSIGYFEADFPGGATAPVHFAQPVPRSAIDATVDVTLRSGDVVPFRRSLHVSPGGEVMITAHP